MRTDDFHMPERCFYLSFTTGMISIKCFAVTEYIFDTFLNLVDKICTVYSLYAHTHTHADAG